MEEEGDEAEGRGKMNGDVPREREIKVTFCAFSVERMGEPGIEDL